MKARPTQSREGVKGGLRPFSSAPCRGKGQRPLWGLGQRPNCSESDQSQGSRQQRCRQRSVPAPNFARPQTRPQAVLPPQDSVKNHKKSMLLNSLKHGFSLFSAQLFQHFIQRAIVLLVLRQRRLRRNHVGFDGGFARFLLLHALRRQLMRPVLRQLHRLLLA